MSPHRVLITGASGFVGSWLKQAIIDLPASDKIEMITAGRDAGCDIQLDVVDTVACTRVIGDIQPTALVHLAAIAAPLEARKNPALAWAVNFQGTMNLANAVLSGAPHCRFVYAGSSEVYGRTFEDCHGQSVNENSPLKPMTTYAGTKAAADLLLGQMHFDGLRTVRFRPFNHTGPGQSASYVVPAFASQIARIMAGKSKPVIEVGNLSAYRDFLDVRDVVRAYVAAVVAEDACIEGQVFNLSSGQPVQIQGILDTLIRLSGRDVEIVVIQDSVRKIDTRWALGDSSAAIEAFNWSVKIPLDVTIANVLNYWRERIALEEE